MRCRSRILLSLRLQILYVIFLVISDPSFGCEGFSSQPTIIPVRSSSRIRQGNENQYSYQYHHHDSQSLMMVSSSSPSPDENNSTSQKWTRGNVPFYQSGSDTDVMPKRDDHLREQQLKHQQRRLVLGSNPYSQHSIQNWGMEQYKDPVPKFADTIDSVAEAALGAISATVLGKQRLDPNLVNNARAQNSIFDYRAVKKPIDAGRIGIEIDGARFLRRNYATVDNANALRLLVLVLANKLSHNHWEEDIASEESSNTIYSDHDDAISRQAPRPVAVYFNTVKQALVASEQLLLLKQQQRQRQSSRAEPSYENVTIHCLSQNDELPLSMLHQKRRRTALQLSRQKPDWIVPSDRTKGFVIVVQPTDFNDEFLPPGPAFGILQSLQRLSTRAMAKDFPVIMVSPRFLVQDDGFGVGRGQGWDQNMKTVSTFGGSEPPHGPTPWILRDFYPPIFCWIGNAASVDAKTRRAVLSQTSSSSHHSNGDPRSFYSRIAITQSVVDEGHPWHIFGVRRTADATEKVPFVYDYLASTMASAGRPTQSIMRRILQEFASSP